MDPHWISFSALIVSVAALGLNIVIYRSNKRKADEGRISELEVSIGKKITTLGDTLDQDITVHRDEEEAHRRDFEQRLDEHSQQLVKLEAKIDGAPTHDDLSALHEKVNEVGNKVSTVDGKLDGVSSNLRQLMARVMERGLP